MSFNFGSFTGGLGNILGGLFGHSSKPYDKAMGQYQQYANQAQQTQQPYLNAGQQAIPAYQQWLQGQQNPTDFINKTMNQYQESPYAQYLQQQSVRAGQNAASASGLIGSTPFADYLQNSANQIASGDQNQWLQNVLGINSQYGQGEQNLMNSGQNAANSLTNLYGQNAKDMAGLAYGKQAGKGNDLGNILSGGLGLLGSFFGL